MCLRHMEDVCKDATARVSKVLRISLNYTEILLKENPQLKIVHLFRDPRSITNSHISTDWFPLKSDVGIGSAFRNDVTITCERMRDDLEAGKMLMKRFPGRFMFLQYEDVLQNSGDKVMNIYRSLRMNHSSNYEKFIQTVSDIKIDKFTTGKIGSLPYRNMLSWEQVRLADQICEDVLKDLGYGTYPSKEHLTNDSFSPFVSPLPYSI